MRNIFTVLTYKCNAKCSFCLFRKDPLKDTTKEKFLESVETAFKMNDQPVKVKITGGEPLIRLELLSGVIQLANKYKEQVVSVGLGTNGFRPLPSFLNETENKILVYVSRHQSGILSAKEFGFSSIPEPKELMKNISSDKIELRLSCTLTRDNVKSPVDLNIYLEWAYNQGIRHLCLRELSHINLEQSPSNYDAYIQDYLDSYKVNLITLAEASDWLKRLAHTSIIEGHKSSRDYVHNEYYLYKDLVIQLRRIDEVGLVEYNSKNPDEIDEFVIHPDGRLTGCWDRNLKIIKGD